MTDEAHAASVGQVVHLGKLEVKADPRNLMLARYIDDAVALAEVPASIDWYAKVTTWPMYGNDTLGDCTCAAVGHMEEAWSATGFDHDDKLTAFDQIDVGNHAHVQFVCWAFGGVYIGVQLPTSAQTQADAWTVTTGADAKPGSWGGHCVNLVDYTPAGRHVSRGAV